MWLSSAASVKFKREAKAGGISLSLSLSMMRPQKSSSNVTTVLPDCFSCNQQAEILRRGISTDERWVFYRKVATSYMKAPHFYQSKWVE